MYDTADHEADVCKYQLDYIEFKPNIDETISPESITRIEFEDYATIDIGYKVEQKIDGVKTMIDISDLLSNGKFLWNNWGTTDDQKITADIKIAKSGYYDIEYLVGHNQSNDGNISIVEFYLNDILIGKNDGSYSEILWEDDTRAWKPHLCQDTTKITSGLMKVSIF